MEDLTPHILELIRLTSTDLPPDVEKSLRAAIANEEPGSAARGALETIIENVELSRKNSTPICQDTGTPIFYVYYPAGWSTRPHTEADRNGNDRGHPPVLLEAKFGRFSHREKQREQPGR